MAEAVQILSPTSARHRGSFLSRIGEGLGYLLFFLMLFFPTTNQIPKGILLGVVCLLILGEVLTSGRIALHPITLCWTLFYVALGLFFIGLGLFRYAPGALRVATVFVVWPLVYLVLVVGASHRNRALNLNRTILIATIAIGAYAALYLLTSTGILPRWLYIDLDQGQAVTQMEGLVSLRTLSSTTLFYTMPYIIAMLLLRPLSKYRLISWGWLWLALVSGIFLVVFRRSNGLYLTTALAPFLTLVFYLLANLGRNSQNLGKIMRIILTLVIVGVVALLLMFVVGTIAGIDFSMLAQSFRSGFEFRSGGDPDGTIRGEQFSALIAAWQQHPIFGVGLGNYTPTYVRTPEMVWAYELFYIALLFQTGIVGILLFGAGIVWIVWNSLQMARHGGELGELMLPNLVGMTCFLVATATNPYLGKYDAMWTIFLPVAMINLYLLATHKGLRTQPGHKA